VNRTKNSTQSVRVASTLKRVPSVGGRLNQAHSAFLREMRELINAAGFPDVSPAFHAIFRYGGPEGRRPTDIATRVGVSKQAVNDALGYFEREGYLKREPDPLDGRAKVVRLTAKGRRLEDAIWTAGQVVDRQWRERFTKEEWKAFRGVLDQLAQAGAPPSSV
jgi:DNA-binding MarR family transcriptional regulator